MYCVPVCAGSRVVCNLAYPLTSLHARARAAVRSQIRARSSHLDIEASTFQLTFADALTRCAKLDIAVIWHGLGMERLSGQLVARAFF